MSLYSILKYLLLGNNVNHTFLKSPLRLMSSQSYESGLKSSYNDVISAAYDFFDQWDPSTATSLEEVCGLQREIC